jgi:hypothetical protein
MKIMKVISESPTKIRIETTALSRRNRKLNISILLTRETSIMESKNPEHCVIFLSSEHIIITTPYSVIKSLIYKLK